jgi:uncharacterized membrane protein
MLVSHSRLFSIVKILSIIGILLAVYLLWQQFFRPAFKPCYISSVVNCDAIVSGPVAKTLGLPTPLYGLIGYIVIFLAAQFRRKKLMLGMATFGLVFCLWIAYQELFLLHVICPVCITCQIIMITVFVVSIRVLTLIDGSSKITG